MRLSLILGVLLLLLTDTQHSVAQSDDVVTPESLRATRARLEQVFQTHLGRQLDCLRPNRGNTWFFLPYDRFDAGDDAAAQKLTRQFSNRLLQLAQKSVSTDAALAYQLLYQALYFGDATVAAEVVGAQSVAPQATLSLSAHPRLGWRRKSFYRIRTEHFQIVTRDEVAGLEIAERLETLYAVWGQLFFRCWSDSSKLARAIDRRKPLLPAIKSRRLLRVVMFANRDEYNEFLQPRNARIGITLGFYEPAEQTSYFFAGEDSSVSNQLHEVTHQLFQEVQSPVAPALQMQQNFWAIEGVAMFMESLQRRGPVASVGGPTADRLQFARYRGLQEQFMVPLAELVGLGRIQLQQDERIRRIYSQSAGLSHFFMNGQQGRYRDAFIDYLQRIYRAGDRKDSLAKATNSTYETLDAEYLAYLNVTDTDLQEAQVLPNSLRSLCLGKTKVTDEGLRHVGSQSELDWLDLTGTAVTDGGVKFLGSSRNLRQVSLDRTQVTDAIVSWLADCAQLEELDLSNTSLTDEGVRQLGRHHSLKVLWLTNTAITDQSVATLSQLSSLEFLSVDGTGVSDQARQKLQQQLPNVRFE